MTRHTTACLSFERSRPPFEGSAKDAPALKARPPERASPSCSGAATTTQAASRRVRR